MFKYTERRGRKGGESNEWKIPSRLLVIYSTHAFLHLTRSSNVFSNQCGGGLCSSSLSAARPSPRMSTVQAAQDDGPGRACHINHICCYAIALWAIKACLWGTHRQAHTQTHAHIHTDTGRKQSEGIHQKRSLSLTRSTSPTQGAGAVSAPGTAPRPHKGKCPHYVSAEWRHDDRFKDLQGSVQWAQLDFRFEVEIYCRLKV